MKWLKVFWRDIVVWINSESPFEKEVHETCEKAEKYIRLQKYYPNILARLNAAVDRKEKVG